ncbi:efflux RND transporter periplasmic adaptor subunit [Argonema antarcticum]|uniref:efflux RND transporter periplasmic adaptor subunit n=1 Tax=Argonema antarcticum TaxID=2942763 RepID=UPI0020112075|nr:efflux RND transporter periplasmic adaptor subunit [Argonema antarcticum]MCL1469366.1 efflux RND transporter periplasmic adaptor subunit [Argonema antarcticum A004/B2]
MGRLQSRLVPPVRLDDNSVGKDGVELKKDPPKFKLKLPKWLLGLLVLGLLAGGGYLAYTQVTTAQRQEARRRIQTVNVERANLPISISANGTVQPERSVNVSPKNSGVLKELLVKEGDRVNTGQILAYMDNSNSQGQLTQAKAQLASAQANLDKLLAGNRPQEIAQAQAQLASAQANLNKLLTGNRPQEIAQAQAQLVSAQANLNKLLTGNRPQEIAQAQAQLVSAQANLNKLLAGNRPQEIAQAQAQLVSAQANLRQTELIFNQNQQLYRAGAISRREVDSSRTSYDTAKAQVEQAKQALNLQQSGTRPEEIAQARAQVEQAKQALNLQQSGTRPEEITQARAQVEQAKQALELQRLGARPEEIAQARAQVMTAEGAMQTVQAQLNDTVIRAPFSGIVTRKFADPGSFVTPTTSGSSVSSATSSSILALASTNQIVAKVAETSIPKIKVGLSVTIEADAYPGQSFQGKVVQVATQSTVEQNVTNFEVKMSLDDPKNLLQVGMNVNVTFNVGTLENALVVPTIAIVRQEQGTGVYLVGQGENRRPRFTPITTGITVDGKTVVVSGVEEGDKVTISFPTGERPASRTPSLIPGMGPQGPGGGGGGGGRRRGGG